VREIRNPLQQYIPKDSLHPFLPIERKVLNKLVYNVPSIKMVVKSILKICNDKLKSL
jgi:hypothetical protein